MKFKTPKGRSVQVFKTNWFTFGFAGHFNLFFISIRKSSWNESLVKHELIHADQCADAGKINYFRMLFDMDYLIKNEIEAYIKDGRFSSDKIARMLSEDYSVFKLFGGRKDKYSYDEIVKMISEYKD